MLVSSSNWKYQLYPLLPYFFRGCVPEMFVTSYSVTYCIYIPGKSGFWFHYYWAVYHECKQPNAFWLADRIGLFVHDTISLLSLYKLIWGHWTDKMSVRYILWSAWGISLVMIERKYTLSYHHHQIGSMNYNPLFRVRSRNNGMRSMSLMDTNSEGMNECERWSTIWKLLIGFANG